MRREEAREIESLSLKLATAEADLASSHQARRTLLEDYETLKAQLQQLAESRSLEIRTEALRQSFRALGDVDLSLTYRIEQYLAKGVTLPTETPNLTTAMSNGMKAVARMTEALDESYSDSLNTIIEALQWAGRVSQENIELAAENERIRQINEEQGDNLRAANLALLDLKPTIDRLEREVHDQANEIEEKTARLKSLEQDSATMKDEDPMLAQAEPSADWLRNAVISLMASKWSAIDSSLRGRTEEALAWVLEDNSQQRFEDLALTNGVLTSAKIINSIREEE